MIDQQQLEAALPAIAESGLPLLVHAELAGPIDEAMHCGCRMPTGAATRRIWHRDRMRRSCRRFG